VGSNEIRSDVGDLNSSLLSESLPIQHLRILIRRLDSSPNLPIVHDLSLLQPLFQVCCLLLRDPRARQSEVLCLQLFQYLELLLFDRWELIQILPIVGVRNLMLIENLVISPVVLLESQHVLPEPRPKLWVFGSDHKVMNFLISSLLVTCHFLVELISWFLIEVYGCSPVSGTPPP